MRIIVGILALCFLASSTLAANCEKNPNHPQCGDPTITGLGELFDANGDLKGTIINLGNLGTEKTTL